MTTSAVFAFPHPELTALADTQPDYLSLQLLHREIQSNAESVPSTRGNGALGHLALTISPADFLVESNGVAFDPPIHPGNAPVHPIAATAAIITEANRKFLADQAEFTIFISVAAQLKRQLLKAVPPPLYLMEICHPTSHFSRLSVLEILSHLDTTYGTLTTDDLAANRKNLDREWTSSQPLEALWDNITRCRHIANALDPISDMAAVQSALDNLDRTGVFVDAVKLWRLRPSAERNLANMKKHFNLANLERKRELTAKAAGYHGAALATAPAVDKALAAVTSTAATTAPPTLRYCWTHGTAAMGHTSANCTKRAAGHVAEATAFNMMGGNNTIRRRRNEQSVFQGPATTDHAAAVVPPVTA
jgi:hypothetical protein